MSDAGPDDRSARWGQRDAFAVAQPTVEGTWFDRCGAMFGDSSWDDGVVMMALVLNAALLRSTLLAVRLRLSAVEIVDSEDDEDDVVAVHADVSDAVTPTPHGTHCLTLSYERPQPT